jgi:hypothetical protein
MLTLILYTAWLLITGSLLVWALTDLYFSSVLFKLFREKGVRMIDTYAENRLKHKLGYLLNCPYCFSHWVAAVVNLILGFLIIFIGVTSIPVSCLILVILLIPVTARIANVIKDHTLPPVTYDDLNPAGKASATEVDIDGKNPNNTPTPFQEWSEGKKVIKENVVEDTPTADALVDAALEADVEASVAAALMADPTDTDTVLLGFEKVTPEDALTVDPVEKPVKSKRTYTKKTSL